jgi:hypothetical protein
MRSRAWQIPVFLRGGDLSGASGEVFDFKREMAFSKRGKLAFLPRINFGVFSMISMG